MFILIHFSIFGLKYTAMSEGSEKFSVKRRMKAFVYAFNGIKYFFRHVQNAPLHALAAVVTVSAGFLVNISVNDWLWITSAIALVFISEMINTAIEKVVDLSTSEIHPLAKQAKDIAAGAVLLACVYAVIVGLFIFLPHFNN